MTSEQVKKAHQMRPFRPFTLHLADGTSVDVTHPEAMLRTQSGRTVVVNTAGDEIEIIDLLLVTKLTLHNGSPTGKRRR
jgi:hypothetical protein